MEFRKKKLYFTAFLISLICECMHCAPAATILYNQIGTEQTLTCKTANTNVKFYKNKKMIEFNNTNNKYHYQYYNNGTLYLEIKTLNLTDDGSGIYSAYISSNTIICTFDIYLCENNDKFTENLTISIDNKELNLMMNYSNITLNNPYNASIGYDYQIKALPLTSSSLAFNTINNNINTKCTKADDKLKCYNGNGLFTADLIKVIGFEKQLKVVAKYAPSSSSSYTKYCNITYSPVVLLFNLHYLIATLKVNGTNTVLKLNNTLKFDYNVSIGNPMNYKYTLNCTYLDTNQTYVSELQFNDTITVQRTFFYTIKKPFINLTCIYCVENLALRLCDSKVYNFDNNQEVDTTVIPTSNSISKSTNTIIIKSTEHFQLSQDSTVRSESLIIGICSSIAGILLCAIIATVLFIVIKKKRKEMNRKYEQALSEKPSNSSSNSCESINRNIANTKKNLKPVKREILDNELYGLPETSEPDPDELNKTKINKSATNADNNIYNLTDDQINILYTPINNQFQQTQQQQHIQSNKTSMKTHKKSDYEDI